MLFDLADESGKKIVEAAAFAAAQPSPAKNNILLGG